ncbi:FirrV-1-A10 [Feldmannia irregularis virus a]|uniref:FirrV-1-A10 n=1 Tax=Feldmannia irregularis virus a TaxID=231992 RepID=Q6XM77_9PHYC|nr:FirrV-1-A10 [Feldmannia irregularis virus a]AAR26834.1 FirrV-1-A10 [Feldmannia irregularis virus a]
MSQYVTVTCDASKTESREIDAKVAKVLRMFHQSLDKRTRDKHRDGTRMYRYKNLSPSQIKLMKKLLRDNKSLLHFDTMTVENSKSSKRSKSSGSSKSSKSSSSSSSSRSSTSSRSSNEELTKKNLTRLSNHLSKALNLVRIMQREK